MEEFESVDDPSGFTWKRKRLPDGADDALKKRIQSTSTVRAPGIRAW